MLSTYSIPGMRPWEDKGELAELGTGWVDGVDGVGGGGWDVQSDGNLYREHAMGGGKREGQHA